MKSILDRSFRYVPSAQTDLRKTFARIRREQKTDPAAVAAETEARLKVSPLRRVKSVSDLLKVVEEKK